MMALLIGLGIAFAIGGLAYLSVEDEIDAARQTAEENGIDPDDFDTSDFSQKELAAADSAALDDDPDSEEEQLATQTFENAETAPESPVSFEPDQEQIVVALDADVDVDAPAQNVFNPETDTTTLSIGDSTVLSLLGDQTDISIGFGTQSETENGLSPFDVVLVQNRLEPV